MALVVAATLTFNACTYWAPQRESVAELRTERHPNLPDLVRITTSDGTVRELQHARLAGDSVFGVASGLPDAPALAVALTDIRRIEVNHVAWGRTIGLGIVTALVLAEALVGF
jgi:hypothetical protein